MSEFREQLIDAASHKLALDDGWEWDNLSEWAQARYIGQARIVLDVAFAFRLRCPTCEAYEREFPDDTLSECADCVSGVADIPRLIIAEQAGWAFKMLDQSSDLFPWAFSEYRKETGEPVPVFVELVVPDQG